MPKSEYPQYEAIKGNLLKRGKPLKTAKRIAAATTHKHGGPVPSSHPRHARRGRD